MKRQILFKNKFKYELENIYSSSHYNSLKKSNINLKELFQKIQYISIFPEMYPKYNNKNQYRRMVIKNYIVIYSIKNDKIFLESIFSQKSKKNLNLN